MKTSKFAPLRVRFLIGLVSVLIAISATANDINNLLNAFNYVTYSPESEKSLKILGEQIHRVVTDKRNAKLLSTPQGKELLYRQRKLSNYLIVKKKLEECTNNSNRELSARLLNAAGKAETIKFDCSNPYENIHSLQKYIGDFKQHLDAQARSELQTNIFEQALRNSASTYLNLKLQYGNSEVKPLAVMDLCKDSSGKIICDDHTQKALIQYAAAYIKYFNNTNIEKTSPQHAAFAINRKIDELNRSFERVEGTRDHGWFGRSTAQEISEDVRRSYLDQYLSAASSGPGVLLLTESMKNKIGGLREADGRKQNREHGAGTKYTYTFHQRVGAQDVSEAVKEAEESLKQQVSNLVEMEDSHQKQIRGDIPIWKNFAFTDPNTLRNTDLSRLLRVSPQTFGQVLISNPQFTTLVCEYMNQVVEKGESDPKWNKSYLWGSMIVGGAPLAIGATPSVDKLIFPKTSIPHALSSVSAITAAAGLSIGMTPGTFQNSSALQARSLQIELENAIGDSPEETQTLSYFNDAKMYGILSLDLSASDVMALVGSIRAAQTGVKAAGGDHVEALKGTTKLINTIAKNPKLVSLVKETRALRGGEGVPHFLGYLGYASEETRNTMLARMISWSPQQFQKIVGGALYGIDGCSK